MLFSQHSEELTVGHEFSQADLLAEGFAANLATLKPLQQRLGLTHAEVAALCGVSPRTYRRWLCDSNPHVAPLRLLAILAGYVPVVRLGDSTALPVPTPPRRRYPRSSCAHDPHGDKPKFA